MFIKNIFQLNWSNPNTQGIVAYLCGNDPLKDEDIKKKCQQLKRHVSTLKQTRLPTKTGTIPEFYVKKNRNYKPKFTGQTTTMPSFFLPAKRHIKKEPKAEFTKIKVEPIDFIDNTSTAFAKSTNGILFFYL